MADLGWHLQLWVDTRDLPEMATQLARMPVPVVVDHMGRLEHHHGTHNPGFQALVRGVGEGRLWAKLSGTYRLGATPPDYVKPSRSTTRWSPPIRDNLVWGTDWPHPRPEGPVPDAQRLLDVFLDWTRMPPPAGDPGRQSGAALRFSERLNERAAAHSPPTISRPPPDLARLRHVSVAELHHRPRLDHDRHQPVAQRLGRGRLEQEFVRAAAQGLASPSSAGRGWSA